MLYFACDFLMNPGPSFLVTTSNSVGTQFAVIGTVSSPKGDVTLLPSISDQNAAAHPTNACQKE